MTSDEFVKWWTSLTPKQRREALEASKRRRAYWMTRRRWCLFGLLEEPGPLDKLFMSTVNNLIEGETK